MEHIEDESEEPCLPLSLPRVTREDIERRAKIRHENEARREAHTRERIEASLAQALHIN